MYAILDHITLAQTITECVLVCDYSCAYFKVFKAMKRKEAVTKRNLIAGALRDLGYRRKQRRGCKRGAAYQMT